MSLSTGLSMPIAAGPAGRADYTIEIAEALSAIEPLWRAFEAQAAATPYQRYDWVAAYAAAFAESEGFSARAAVIRAPSGTVEMLVPIAVSRRNGLTVGEGIGGKQANYHLPLIAREGARFASPAEARALLCRLGKTLGLDAFAFENMPTAWQGETNPFAAVGAKAAPSNAYAITLSADASAVLNRLGSSESRRKLRKKEAALGRLGPITYRLARNAAEADEILDAFCRQKAERFAGLGIQNPFDDPAARRFLHEAALAGLAEQRPAIELHGLWLGEKVVATYGGGLDDERFSCMFNSFDADPELSRHSPGDLLLLRVVRTQCERGRKLLDLGVGEARYKSSVCDRTEELVDLFFPVSAKGRLYVALREGKAQAKRRIKQTPWAWSLVVRLRAARARLGR